MSPGSCTASLLRERPQMISSQFHPVQSQRTLSARRCIGWYCEIKTGGSREWHSEAVLFKEHSVLSVVTAATLGVTGRPPTGWDIESAQRGLASPQTLSSLIISHSPHCMDHLGMESQTPEYLRLASCTAERGISESQISFHFDIKMVIAAVTSHGEQYCAPWGPDRTDLSGLLKGLCHISGLVGNPHFQTA